jgi:ribosome biogenesis GTPase
VDLKDMGWNSAFNLHFEEFEDPTIEPARIVRQDRMQYLARSEGGEVAAEVSGRMLHSIKRRSEFPVVGDWVVLRANPKLALIDAVLPRKSAFSRQAVGGKAEEQVLAANLDTLFLVTGLDGDYNVRRIERYVNLAMKSGATPVLILNKTDVCEDVAVVVDEVLQIASGCDIHCLSAQDGTGFELLEGYLTRGSTAALLGSSGVGKSSIVNRLLQSDRQSVAEVREGDSRGRHTTVRRELFFLPSGGAIIDTPGIREVGLSGEEKSLGETFPDIEAFASGCRFSDCSHLVEPGCGVLDALGRRDLDAARYESYKKLKTELEHAARQRELHESRVHDRTVSKMVRDVSQTKYRDRED